MVHAKLKKLKSGSTIEHRFRAADTLHTADLETHELDFLYGGGGHFTFMNAQTYEQYDLDEETLGDAAKWVVEGLRIIAEFYEGRPVAIDLPSSLVFEIVDTTPVMKSATKTASSKPARLTNGVTINVPEFVGPGEKVRVNPNTGEYLDRAKD
jgi:elongation factor P